MMQGTGESFDFPFIIIGRAGEPTDDVIECPEVKKHVTFLSSNGYIVDTGAYRFLKNGFDGPGLYFKGTAKSKLTTFSCTGYDMKLDADTVNLKINKNSDAIKSERYIEYYGWRLNAGKQFSASSGMILEDVLLTAEGLSPGIHFKSMEFWADGELKKYEIIYLSETIDINGRKLFLSEAELEKNELRLKTLWLNFPGLEEIEAYYYIPEKACLVITSDGRLVQNNETDVDYTIDKTDIFFEGFYIKGDFIQCGRGCCSEQCKGCRVFVKRGSESKYQKQRSLYAPSLLRHEKQ
jgi:hypothetical protein